MLKYAEVFTRRINAIYGNLWLDQDEFFNFVYYNGESIEEERLNKLDCYYSGQNHFNMPVAQTYSYFYKYIEYLYTSHPEVLEREYKWIWQMFDIIVFDEVHTLMLEASYQDCAPIILGMIKWLAQNKERYPEKRIVFMSGTPSPVLPMLKKFCGEIYVFNAMSICKCVKPNRIVVIDSRDKTSKIQEIYDTGDKCIDFYNGKVRTLLECVSELDIKYEDVLSLTSKWNESRRFWKSSLNLDEKMTVRSMEEAEDIMHVSQMLPDKYKYICSTGAYAEAETWNNEDIHFMFVDSHIGPRVVQCSGRLRKADFTLFIVTGTYQFRDKLEEELEVCLACKDERIQEDLNEQFRDCYGDEERDRMIKGIPESYPGLYFDYLSGQFEYNWIKEKSLKYQLKEIKAWDEVDRNRGNCYHNLIRSWFGADVEIEDYYTKEALVRKLLHDSGIRDNGCYTKERIKNLAKQIDSLLNNEKGCRINTYLKKFMPNHKFVLVNSGKDKGKYQYVKTIGKC